jgi:hypothetical protein
VERTLCESALQREALVPLHSHSLTCLHSRQGECATHAVARAQCLSSQIFSIDSIDTNMFEYL